MKWLSIPIGARASGIGGAYTALSTGAEAIFWNPSGIAMAENKYGINLNQTNWIADITVNSGAFAYNAGSLGSFGLSYLSVDWGDLHGTEIDQNSTTGFQGNRRILSR